MATLFPPLPFMADETHLSWTGRMAALHLGGDAGPFLTDMRLPHQPFFSGYPEMVGQLCAIAEQDPEPVLHNTILRNSAYTYRLRGHDIGSGLLNGRMTHFCPKCLMEDDALGPHPHRQRRERLAWLFRVVTVCPDHNVRLLHAGPQPGIMPGLSRRVPLGTAEMRYLAEHADAATPSPLQDYLLGRLDGAKGPDWLDDQGLEQAIRATEMIGAVLAFGTKFTIQSLRVNDWHAAACEGWRWTSRGEAGLKEAFDLIKSKWAPPSQRRERASNYGFGILYHWLANPHLKTPRGPLKDILRDHIFETEHFVAERQILGEVRRPNCRISQRSK
jgi:hypothetical protein